MDFPAELEYISNATNRTDLIVVAYSMGATEALIYNSVTPKHAARYVKLFVCVGPTVFLPEDKMMSRRIDPRTVLQMFYSAERPTVLPSFAAARAFQRRLCLNHRFKFFCVARSIRIAGGTQRSFRPELVPILFANNPTRISLKVIIHYNQVAFADRFQFYDYGRGGNLLRYRNPVPPEFPLGDMIVPVYIVYGQVDSSCTLENVERLYGAFSPRAKVYGKFLIDGFNHIDFLYSRYSYEQFVLPLIAFIKTHFE